MKSKLLWILIIILVIVAVVFALIPRQGKAPTVPQTHSTSTPPALAADLYPLYPDFQWNSTTTAENVLIGTTTYSGARITSEAKDAGMNPGAVFTPFQKYYENKLRALGWSVANDLAAGGHVGGQDGYRKGRAIILVSFHIDYQNRPANAPSECPCSVSLSLFSGK